MKKIPIIFIALFPYLFALLTYIIFSESKVLGELELIKFAIMTIIMIMLVILNLIITIIVLAKKEFRSVQIINLILKIIYIPAHIFLIFLSSAMANPFLLLVMWIPIAISFALMGITGTVGLVGIIKGYLDKRYSLGGAIIFSILSYLYIFDIVIAIIVCIKARKIKN